MACFKVFGFCDTMKKWAKYAFPENKIIDLEYTQYS